MKAMPCIIPVSAAAGNLWEGSLDLGNLDVWLAGAVRRAANYIMALENHPRGHCLASDLAYAGCAAWPDGSVVQTFRFRNATVQGQDDGADGHAGHHADRGRMFAARATVAKFIDKYERDGKLRLLVDLPLNADAYNLVDELAAKIHAMIERYLESGTHSSVADLDAGCLATARHDLCDARDRVKAVRNGAGIVEWRVPRLAGASGPRQ